MNQIRELFFSLIFSPKKDAWSASLSGNGTHIIINIHSLVSHYVLNMLFPIFRRQTYSFRTTTCSYFLKKIYSVCKYWNEVDFDVFCVIIPSNNTVHVFNKLIHITKCKIPLNIVIFINFNSYEPLWF